MVGFWDSAGVSTKGSTKDSTKDPAQVGELEFPQQSFGAADPNAVPSPLEIRGVGIISHHLVELWAGEFRLVARDIKLSELNLGPGVGMVFGDILKAASGSPSATSVSARAIWE